MSRRLDLEPDQVIDFKRYYAYGSIINFIPLYVFYPIRTGKTLQQANIGTGLSTSLVSVIVERFRTEGARGLYKGIGVYALGSISGRLVHFATYDALRERVYNGRGNEIGLGWLEGHDTSSINGILGTTAAITTASFMVPFDVISQQLQVSKKTSINVPGTTSAKVTSPISRKYSMLVSSGNKVSIPFRKLHSSVSKKNPTFNITFISEHNILPKLPLTNNLTTSSPPPPSQTHKNFIARLKPENVPWHRFLYRGWTATILNALSFFPAYFYMYTFTMEQLEIHQHHFRFLPAQNFVFSVASGVVAGVTATATSAPFDVVKTRIQIARKAGQKNIRWLANAKTILRTQGIRGMYVGMSARLSIIVPIGSLNFYVFEKVREWSTIRVELPKEKL